MPSDKTDLNHATVFRPVSLENGPFMCARCVSDGDLKEFIRDNLVSQHCDFCDRESRRKLIAAEAESVADRVCECISQEFEDAAEMVPYESAEGGYQGPVMTPYELLCEEAGLDPGTNEKAFEYLVDQLPDHPWAQKNFFSLTPYQVWRHGWEGFVNAVKHHNRYLFFPRRKKSPWPPDEEGIRPERMLAELAVAIRDTGLVRKLRAGTLLYRVRPHEATDSPTTLAELGPPPTEKAIHANRMSPAGVSMLYAAEDEATALAETPNNGHKDATIATLRVDSTLRIVDLVNLPPSPGLFTPGTDPESRALLNFVHAFARDISEPVARDGQEHIDYVPTQIVTEYLRHRFRTDGKRVYGIRYPSAKRKGGVNLTLFLGGDDLETSVFGITRLSKIKLSVVDYRRVPLP